MSQRTFCTTVPARLKGYVATKQHKARRSSVWNRTFGGWSTVARLRAWTCPGRIRKFPMPFRKPSAATVNHRVTFARWYFAAPKSWAWLGVNVPRRWSSILSGIPRDSAMTIAKDLGYEIREQIISRDMLYIADEIFFTGTAAEITPIRSVDKIIIGKGHRGPITTALQEQFFAITKGDVPDRYNWLTPVSVREVR